eukprot:TRINITY_DN1152_c0_g1_i4.p1 TRINITY_DN1152_c0_g1~~TRINITY_DN1152_c0_g1_i4.p1  ORF type:complete len:1226 (-),score=102.03 TRINITY_DN1152_c0_g1_i4:99-3776(-)
MTKLNLTAIYLLIILLFSNCINQASGFTCDHDNLNYKVLTSDKPKDDNFRRNLDSSTYSTIRITVDYTYLSALSSDLKNYIINIVESAILYFESVLKVIPITGNNMFPSGSTQCYSDYTVPSADKSTGIANSDLHLYVMYTYASSASYVANAVACVVTTDLGRPCFGRINYNTYYMNDLDLTDTLEFKNYVQTSIHEITHVLGFSSSLYSYWRDRTNSFSTYSGLTSTITLRGMTTTLLKSPTILSFAKSYYGCSSLTGMYIENQGGSGSAGSHWEVLISYGENMNAQVIPTNGILSQFTLSLLYDTGWYDVDFTLAEYIGWGKGKGCDFINNGCNSTTSYEEFNLNQANKCTYDRIAYGYPYMHPFADYCYITSAYSNTFCTFSSNYFTGSPRYPTTFTVGSRCFTSTYVQKSPSVYSNQFTVGCHEFQCSTDKSQVTITMGDSSITCTSNSQVISSSVTSGSYTYQGSLTCPADITNFCSQTGLCSNHCSVHGVCVQGVCHCLDAYAGTSCSVTCSTYLYGSDCLTACPTSYYHNVYNRQCVACTSDTSSYTECQVGCSAANCLVCVGGSTSQCLQCDEDNQFYLQGDTTSCGTCATTAGYYVTSDTYKKCKACISHCVLCSTGTTCTQCDESSYFLYASTSTCGTCDTNNGYYVTNDQYKKCASCSQSNCLSCTAGTGASCTKCNQDSGFYLNVGGTCQSCDTTSGYYITSDTIKQCLVCSQSHCSICTAGTGTGCTKCDQTNGYYLQEETTICGTCDTSNGHYITSDTYKKCKACSTHCLECTSSTCTKCDQTNGYYILTDGTCGTCTSTSGYYISSDTNKKCLQCTQSYCKTCTAGTGQTCTLCDTSASKYLDSSTSLCVSCNTVGGGKYISTDQVYCKSCTQTNCLACTVGSGASCTLCNEANGYYVILSSGNCGACNANLCGTCTGSSEYCATCDTTKHRVSSPTSGVCACETGYFQNSQKLCSTCHYSCLTCSNAYSCDTCQSDATTNRESTPLTDGVCPCKSGYKDDGSGINCVSSLCYYACSTCSINSNQYGCQACSSSNHRTLTQSNECACEDGYYDNSVSEMCSTCSSTCKTCTDYSTCTACYSSQQRELKSAATQCTCIDGYYESSDNLDICPSCHYSCATCSNGNECLTCRQSSEYYRELTPDGTTQLCKCLDGYEENSEQAACVKSSKKNSQTTKIVIIAISAGVPGSILIGIVVKKLFFRSIKIHPKKK